MYNKLQNIPIDTEHTKDPGSFLFLLFGVCFIAASLANYSTIPRVITVSDKGIDIDGELVVWEDIERIESKLTYRAMQLVIDVYLKDDQDFRIIVESFRNKELLERKLVHHAKELGIYKSS
jgi:hypothetical protein